MHIVDGALAPEVLIGGGVLAVAGLGLGRIMFELDGIPWALARDAFKLASAKLPIDTKIVRRLGDNS